MPSFVIVGASRGLGYAFLQFLSKKDPSNIVIGLVRSPEQTKEKVAADGLKNVQILHGDLDSHVSLKAAAERTAELTGGAVDYLIVNGAQTEPETVMMSVSDYVGKEDLFVEALDFTMHTQVAGTLFAFNAFMPLVLKSDIRRIAAVTSASAEIDFIRESGDAGNVAYAVSKAALNTLVAKFAATYKDKGVLFLSLHPGFVRTFPDAPPEMAAVGMSVLRRWDPKLERPLEPMESAEMLVKVLAEAKVEQSGEVLSQHGNKVWLVSR